MAWLARAPPVVRLALAVTAGATAAHLGIPLHWVPPLLLSLLLPIQPSIRPLLLAAASGAFFTHAWQERTARDCRFHLEDGALLEVTGHFLGRLEEGRGELVPKESGPGGCGEVLRVIIPSAPPADIAAGDPLTVFGRWRRGGPTPRPLWAGYLKADSIVGAPQPETSLRARFDAVRGTAQARLRALFPARHALAEALVLARKEGLQGGTREAFARGGVAHLLAISGFHVGVVAGILLLLAQAAGIPLRIRYLLAGVAVWSYVVLIGLPDAAVRAALILSVVAVGRLQALPVSSLGALATAYLLFFLADPGAVLRPGLQLSFAGAAGLILLGPMVSERLTARLLTGRHNPLLGGLSAGVAATLSTLPLVAWHFGRVSLVGIPLTLLVAPLVALAIPGIFGVLCLSAFGLTLARPLAGGVDLLLAALSCLVDVVAGLPFAAVWVSRAGVVAAGAGLGLAWAAMAMSSKRPGFPRALLFIGALSAALLWPAVEVVVGRGSMELVVLDVGQGDALALRSPAGRWLLVDAGPASDAFDAGERRVVPYLRGRGVDRLELLVLTHPDMDHIGGAQAVMAELEVGGILDPGASVGKGVFVDLLRAAEEKGVPWRTARAGDSLDLDGVALRVLSPDGHEGDSGAPGDVQDANDASLVLELRFGSFAALLTGDAPLSAEASFVGEMLSDRTQLLKVGHHGSATSTSRELLARSAPEIAMISVGRRNRYGHPHPVVLGRLEGTGARVFRTDRSGTLVVKARRDGSYRVTPRGSP